MKKEIEKEYIDLIKQLLKTQEWSLNIHRSKYGDFGEYLETSHRLNGKIIWFSYRTRSMPMCLKFGVRDTRFDDWWIWSENIKIHIFSDIHKMLIDKKREIIKQKKLISKIELRKNQEGFDMMIGDMIRH